VAVIVLIVVSLLAGAGVLARPEPVARLLGAPTVDWRRGVPPAAPGLVLPVVAKDAPAPTADGLTRALADPLSDSALAHASVSVVDVATGQRLYDRSADTASLPASTTKLLTATAVLAARGPAYRLTTRAVAGPNPGDVVLVGAGDPTLAAGANATYVDSARLDDLAAQVKQALAGTSPARVIVDGSLFTGPTAGPGWDDDATAGYGAPITALMIDGARTSPVPPHGFASRSTQPDLAAGQALAAALGLSSGAVTRGSAPAEAKPLGSVSSPPMVRLVEQMLVESDNVIAECLARQVALARSQPASFAGAAAAVTAALADLGLTIAPGVLVDGSGLSRNDRLSPAFLTGLLALDAKGEHPELRSVFNGLPVAGYSGTLRDRYRKPATGGKAAGVVRAKTGTLTPGVSAIAGVVVDADGRTLAFAVLATVGDNAFPAQDALDRFAATLAACGCR
jgi:D-alanyl-D-alanine carboxypeptidase/D-alanyl-D-alanine-endopeptidase (penicillin-binding protein 4)